MKILVTIVVYNRFDNLNRWLHCWQKCNTENAELVVIHTGDEIEKFKLACSNIAAYIHRQNIGFDIGCLQDVCLERLNGFPNDWDYLLWITDDTIPMTKDFITPFIKSFDNPEVGLSCMQISKSKPGNIVHVRTTGFCIPKNVSLKLTFPADPVKTKQDCYHFEHRGGQRILSEQVRQMGLDVVQVATNDKSPLWDSGFWKRLDRQSEYDNLFGNNNKSGDKVTFVCTIYNSFPQIISSLLLQTHKNWELILIHDGKNETGLKDIIQAHCSLDTIDSRIKYIESDERVGKWGHIYRQKALREYDLGDFVVISNADNYYTPVFIEYMLRGFKKSHTAVAVYCDKMTHSYKAWDVIHCKLGLGYLDCGGVMVRSNIAKDVGWRDVESHSADWVYFQDIANKYSWSNFIPVKGNLFVHN